MWARCVWGDIVTRTSQIFYIRFKYTLYSSPKETRVIQTVLDLRSHFSSYFQKYCNYFPGLYPRQITGDKTWLGGGGGVGGLGSKRVLSMRCKALSTRSVITWAHLSCHDGFVPRARTTETWGPSHILSNGCIRFYDTFSKRKDGQHGQLIVRFIMSWPRICGGMSHFTKQRHHVPCH